jgi:hypothetical protein
VTSTINGHRPPLTDGDDVRMCVRAPETPATGPKTPVERDDSAYTRVIQDDATKVKRSDKIRDTASLHVAEVASALAGNATVNELPLTIAEAWRQAVPTKGEHGGRAARLAFSVGGVHRAIVATLAWGLLAAHGTRLRALVGLALLLTTVAAVALAGSLLR